MTETAPGELDINTYGLPLSVYKRRWIILGVLNTSLIMVVTSVSSLNVALPTVQQSLGTTGTQLQWIVDAYALVFAGLLLPAGALGDRFGRRGALLTGLVVFGTSAFLASQAGSATTLIAMRACMGVGAALIMPATLSIIINSFPFHERPKAIAIWAAFAGVGGALGPISSGLLLDHFWWGSVFFLNVVLSIIVLTMVIVVVPTSRNPVGHAFDPIGSLLSMLGLVSLVFAVIEGPEQGWGDVVTIGAFVLAAVMLFAFVRYELSKANPMLDPRLFRLPGFSGGSIGVTLVFLNMFAMFFLLTQYLQYVQNHDALGAGIRVIPSAVTLMVVGPQGPRLMSRFGVKRVVRTGFLASVLGFTLLATASADTPYVLVALSLMCIGAGIALISPGCSQHIVGSLPLAKAGVGSAMNDVTREVGGALGIAIAGSIVASVYRDHTGFTASLPSPAEADLASDSVGKATGVLRKALSEGRISSAKFDELHAAAGDAFVRGTHVAFAALAVTSAVAAYVVGRVIPDRLPERQVADHSPQ